MKYTVVYDGRCNLCSNLVQALEQVDRGERFDYIPMQAEDQLQELNVQSCDCELGMILIDQSNPDRRWQGSDAAEEIAKLMPLSAPLVNAYRALPGLKSLGDYLYEQIRDNRYSWFGERQNTYESSYSPPR